MHFLIGLTIIMAISIASNIWLNRMFVATPAEMQATVCATLTPEQEKNLYEPKKAGEKVIETEAISPDPVNDYLREQAEHGNYPDAREVSGDIGGFPEWLQN